MSWFIKYFLATLVVFSLCFSIKAQETLARINDKDGFTNVREGQGADFKIIGVIKESDLFYFEPSNSDWYKVTMPMWSSDVKGYIHKSKIELIDTLPVLVKCKLIQSIFDKQKELANKFENTFLNNDSLLYTSSRKALEDYSESNYSPILPVFSDYFCKINDSITLNKFFAAMWADKGSANELPGDYLGECIVCSPDILIRQIKQIKNKEEQQLIIDAGNLGIDSYFEVSGEALDIPPNPDKNKVLEHNKLAKKLNSVLK